MTVTSVGFGGGMELADKTRIHPNKQRNCRSKMVFLKRHQKVLLCGDWSAFGFFI